MVDMQGLFVFIPLMVLLSCANREDQGSKPLAPVFVRKIEIEQISDTFSYPSRVNARVNAKVLSETDGIMSQQLVRLGQGVKEKQVLMIITHTDPVYTYAPVQVLSPIQGIVSSIDATPGSHVVKGQALASVINPSQIEIQMEIPAQDLSFIKKGMIGKFKVPGQEKALEVQVFGVSPLVKPGTGTATAQLRVTSFTGQSLSPGMQGQVLFQVNLHSGFLIPVTAIVYKSNKTFVKIVEHGKIKQVPVELGAKRRGYVEVRNGLDVGLQLVERASRSVAEGESVFIENAQPSQESQ